MDPISAIVSALVLGFAAGLKPVAEAAIKEAYAGLKTLIQDRYRISLENFEHQHASEAQQTAIKESLKEAQVGEDPELLERAKTLTDAVEAHDPQVGQTIGIDLQNVKAAFLKIAQINATGGSIGAKVTGGEFPQGMDFGTINANSNTAPKN